MMTVVLAATPDTPDKIQLGSTFTGWSNNQDFDPENAQQPYFANAAAGDFTLQAAASAVADWFADAPLAPSDSPCE
jgi:hypothetical protein